VAETAGAGAREPRIAVDVATAIRKRSEEQSREIPRR